MKTANAILLAALGVLLALTTRFQGQFQEATNERIGRLEQALATVEKIQGMQVELEWQRTQQLRKPDPAAFQAHFERDWQAHFERMKVFGQPGIPLEYGPMPREVAGPEVKAVRRATVTKIEYGGGPRISDQIDAAVRQGVVGSLLFGPRK